MTVIALVKIDISYSQFVVFRSAIQEPFNEWSEKHVAQGFSWRPGCVSFRTLVEFGVHSLEIAVVERFEALEPEIIRAIEVPFEVSSEGDIEIASISDSVQLTLPSGNYCLRCEFLGDSGEGGQSVRLVFARDEAPRFALVKIDAQLSSNEVLLTNAKAAST